MPGRNCSTMLPPWQVLVRMPRRTTSVYRPGWRTAVRTEPPGHAGAVCVGRPLTSGVEYPGSATGVPVLQVGAGLNRPEPAVQPWLARMLALAGLAVRLPAPLSGVVFV